MPHVAVLAPMPLELDAVVAAFGLSPSDADGDTWTGRVGRSDVTAVRCGMGPPAAREATARLLDRCVSAGVPVSHVMVVGICGGLDPDVPVGTLVVPDRIVDHDSGAVYRHDPPGGPSATGAVVTTADVSFDHDLSRRLFEDGALGVDMESSAVAEVCEARGCPWSVVRCISDRWVDGLLDPRVVALTGVDGSMDLDALGRLLADEPDLVPRLERLGNDAVLAARLAAEAAVRACAALDAPAAG